MIVTPVLLPLRKSREGKMHHNERTEVLLTLVALMRASERFALFSGSPFPENTESCHVMATDSRHAEF